MSKLFGFMKKNAKGSENVSEPKVDLREDNMPFLDSNDGDLNLDDMLGEELVVKPTIEPHFSNSDVDFSIDKWNEETEVAQLDENPLPMFDEEPLQIGNSWLETGNDEVAEDKTILNGSWLDGGDIAEASVSEDVEVNAIGEENNSWVEEKKEAQLQNKSFEKEGAFFEQDSFLTDNMQMENVNELVETVIEDSNDSNGIYEPEIAEPSFSSFAEEEILEPKAEFEPEAVSYFGDEVVDFTPEIEPVIENFNDSNDSNGIYESEIAEPSFSPFAEEEVLEPKAEFEPEVEAEAVIDYEPEVEAEAVVDYEPEVEAEAVVDYEPEVEAEAVVDYEPEVEAEAVIDYEPEVEAEAVVDYEPEVEAEAVIDYESEVEMVVVPEVRNKSTKTTGTIGFIKWYSGSLYDEYFEVSKTSVSETIIGDENNNAIHVNVGSDTYGWNVEFASGLQMSLRDVKTYQLRNGSLPETQGCIIYGNMRIEFVNIKRISVYETVEYFSY